jgi:hypothetical protein
VKEYWASAPAFPCSPCTSAVCVELLEQVDIERRLVGRDLARKETWRAASDIGTSSPSSLHVGISLHDMVSVTLVL